MSTFLIGQRVELHPATDAWMRGLRYGSITKIGVKWVHVLMDRNNRVLRVHPNNLIPIA